jgi:hypothetical protein
MSDAPDRTAAATAIFHSRRGEVFEKMVNNSDSGHLAIHGRFDEDSFHREEPGRVAYGVYRRSSRDNSGLVSLCPMADDETICEEIHIRARTDLTLPAGELKEILTGHPVWSVTLPDTIIHVEARSVWCDTWNAVLSYSDAGFPDGTVGLRDDVAVPSVSNNRQFAIHFFDGQDLHHPVKLLGIVDASSHVEAHQKFADKYTQIRCPPRWHFASIEIATQHEYDIESFDFDITLPREAGGLTSSHG